MTLKILKPFLDLKNDCHMTFVDYYSKLKGVFVNSTTYRLFHSKCFSTHGNSVNKNRACSQHEPDVLEIDRSLKIELTQVLSP